MFMRRIRYSRAMADVFGRLERFHDGVPRQSARAETFGELVLFVRQGEGWPFAARPRAGGETPSAADVTAVRRRQRELGVPETFEWVHENRPGLLAVARSAGLDVQLAPLLVLEPAALLPELPVDGATVRVLSAADPGYGADLAAAWAVSRLGFGTPAHVTPLEGPLSIAQAGPAERDAAVLPATGPEIENAARNVYAVVDSPAEGVLATGMIQAEGEVAEIAGVATLPSARRRGYATQLTATLARRALLDGAALVFLSAGNDDVARLYTRVGFRRAGTACVASG